MPEQTPKTKVGEITANQELSEMENNENNSGTGPNDMVTAIENKNQPPAKSAKRGLFHLRRGSAGRQKEISRDLAEVYTDDDGVIPDLTRLESNERPLWQTIVYTLIAVLAVLLVGAAVIYLILANLNSDTFTNERITFKLEPPISIVSGQEGTYTIIIANRERVNLYDLDIELKYPDTFQLVSSSPVATGDKRNIWNISVLKIGETQKIELRGKIIAPLDSVQTVTGAMTFKPANLNAEFSQKFNLDMGVNASTIILTVSGPDKTLANQGISYTVDLRNVGTEVLNDLEVVAEYPPGFVLSSTTPAAKDGTNNVWSVAKLATSTDMATSSDQKIIIGGNYSGIVDSGNQEFKVKVNLKNQSEYILQSEQSAVTAVVKDQLSLSVIVNGSGEDQPVSFGDLLVYTINFKNTGTEDLKNVELTAKVDSQILDWATLSSDHEGKVNEGIIVWTGKELPSLLNLRPGEEGAVTFQLRVKDLAAISSLDVSKFSVESSAQAKIKNADGVNAINSKIITNSINSDLSLIAAARYYNEDNLPLGSGPITPQADETSSYNIRLSLTNNLHDIGNIEVSAILPKFVNWDDKENHNTGDFLYNSKTKKLSWRISKLPKSVKDAAIDFNVSIKPTTDDIGRVLILIPEFKLTAKDLETGSDISKTIRAVTTAFSDPIMGNLSGIVE
ncbi:MAG: hypothetical protein WC668_02290 [Patescibacteria group bacterium]|jgi:uncharacterized repeat protein (TIGR01451 family)